MRAAAVCLASVTWLAGCSANVAIALTPAAPTTHDALHASVSDDNATVWWFVDDLFVSEGLDIPATYTAKGQTWRAEAHRGAMVVDTTHVTIGNAAPEIHLTLPSVAAEHSDVLPTLELTDADGDEISWTLSWSQDGNRQPDVETLALPADLAAPDTHWTLTVTATDGETSTVGEATVHILVTPPPPPSGEALFNGVVREVHLTVGDEAAASLRTAPTTWVHADVELDGVLLTDIGLRLKGNGSFAPFDDKPSFRLDLDRYVDHQAFDGLDELVLNNMRLDPSNLHEHIAYEVYRALDVPAPRSQHAGLWLGDDDYGAYVIVEGIDGRFLNRWFEAPNGPLYEMFDVDFVPDDIALFDHDNGPDTRDTLYAVAEALQQPDPRFSSDLAHLIDMQSFANYFGASAAIGQFDAYPWSFPGDDLYVYIDPSDGLIRFIAHGADETFANPWRPVDYVYGALGTACLNDSVCRALWADAVWRTVTHMEQHDTRSRISTVSDEIATIVVNDTRRPFTLGAVEAALIAMDTFVATRRSRLHEMPGLP